MEIFYTPNARNSIALIVAFVESKNTIGSGHRFALKLESAVNKYAKENVEYSLCNNKILASLGYLCINFNWVLAFKIKHNKFIVYRIVWGGILK